MRKPASGQSDHEDGHPLERPPKDRQHPLCAVRRPRRDGPPVGFAECLRRAHRQIFSAATSSYGCSSHRGLQTRTDHAKRDARARSCWSFTAHPGHRADAPWSIHRRVGPPTPIMSRASQAGVSCGDWEVSGGIAEVASAAESLRQHLAAREPPLPRACRQLWATPQAPAYGHYHRLELLTRRTPSTRAA